MKEEKFYCDQCGSEVNTLMVVRISTREADVCSYECAKVWVNKEAELWLKAGEVGSYGEGGDSSAKTSVSNEGRRSSYGKGVRSHCGTTFRRSGH